MKKNEKIIIFIIFTIYVLYVYNMSFRKSYKVYNHKINDSNKLKEFVLNQNLDKNGYSNHFWYNDLPVNIKNNLNNISEYIKEQISNIHKIHSKYIYTIHDMSEIAVTGTKKSNAEKIFFQRHYDGPFLLYPCKIERVIIAIQGKDSTHTIFEDQSISLKTNEGMLFDYDRSPHYITVNKNQDNKSKEKRILLKLHYYIYNPSFFELFSKYICIQPHINYAYYSRDDLEKNKNIDGLRSKLILIFGFIFTNFDKFAYLSYISFIIYLISKKNIFLYLCIFLILVQILLFSISLSFIFKS